MRARTHTHAHTHMHTHAHAIIQDHGDDHMVSSEVDAFAETTLMQKVLDDAKKHAKTQVIVRPASF